VTDIDLGPYTIEQVRDFWDRMVERNPIEKGEQGDQYVLFRLASTHFALKADSCRGVVSFRQPSPLPVLPPHIIGVASVRGRPISVTDLSVFFGLKGPTRGGHMLIVQAQGEETAIRVDWVESVVELDISLAEPPEAKWHGLRTGLVLGAMDYKGLPLIVLDPARCIKAVESE